MKMAEYYRYTPQYRAIDDLRKKTIERIDNVDTSVKGNKKPAQATG